MSEAKTSIHFALAVNIIHLALKISHGKCKKLMDKLKGRGQRLLLFVAS